jgi:hypothetical protein
VGQAFEKLERGGFIFASSNLDSWRPKEFERDVVAELPKGKFTTELGVVPEEYVAGYPLKGIWIFKT